MATGRAQKSRDTLAELRIRKALRDVGLDGYVLGKTINLPQWGNRRQYAMPDVFYDAEMVCVFVDGCAWHGCPKHFKDYNTNQEYWRRKRAQQRARDQRHSRALETMGYRVARFWECEDPNLAAKAVRAVIDTGVPPGIYGLPTK